MKADNLSGDQRTAVEYMALRQLRRWPETKFEVTSNSTYADHPACGGTNKLYINRTTAMSLVDRGICVMSDAEDQVWLAPGAMQLINIGDSIAREM